MPLTKEKKARYPKDWKEISHRIRFERALGFCEMRGCLAEHLQPHPITGSKVVLTVAHLGDQNPENCEESNLMAMCQMHHLAFDREQRKKPNPKIRRCSDCGVLQDDNWPKQKEGSLCQGCWEIECDNAWWKAVRITGSAML